MDDDEDDIVTMTSDVFKEIQRDQFSWSIGDVEIKAAARKSEEELREEFPALKDAWEKYQIVLKMVSASKSSPEGEELSKMEQLKRIRRLINNSMTVDI